MKVYTDADPAWAGSCLCEDREAHDPDCRQGHRPGCPGDCWGVSGCPQRHRHDGGADRDESELDIGVWTLEDLRRLAACTRRWGDWDDLRQTDGCPDCGWGRVAHPTDAEMLARAAEPGGAR